MKKENRIKLAVAVILLVLFALTQLFCALRVQSLENGLPNAATLSNSRGIGITMKRALNMEKLAAGAMTAEQLQLVTNTGTGSSVAAYTAFATPGAGMCMPFRYIYGNWFLPGRDTVAPYAVIPESLSLSLFGTYQPEGGSITVGQTEYMICGVYREEKGFLYNLSSDGLPRVYLCEPLRMAELPVSMLYLTDAKNSDAQYLKQQVSGIQKTQLFGEITDYRPQSELAHSLWYLSVLICALFCAVLLLHFAGRQLIGAATGQKETVSKRIARLLIGVLIIAGTLLLLSMLLSKLRIPAAYLPHDNIFEFTFYIKSIETFFAALHNAGSSSHFEWIFVTQLLALLFWALLGIVFFCIGALNLRRWITGRYASDK